ncbi:MAG: AI-2E family transporter [Syntrophomonadaceae bacterium]|nr:AI-2E family transporter [Syntrophomonadaceae bacterium]
MIAINIKMTKSLMLLFTYAAVLLLIVLNFKPIMNGLGVFISFFTPFFIGIVIAFILNEPAMYFEKVLAGKVFKKDRPALTRALAILIAHIMVLLLLFLLIMFIIPPLIENIRLFSSNVGTYVNNTQAWLNQLMSHFRLESFDLSGLTDKAFGALDSISANMMSLLSQIIIITTSVIGFIVTLFIAIIFSIFLLAGKETILHNCDRVFRAYLPDKVYETAAYVNRITIDTFNRYIYGQLTEAFILGVLCFTGMMIFGFHYPLMISTLIGLTALVPLIGALIGGFISSLLLLMISPMEAIWFLVFLVILQQFEGNVIYPRVVGSSLGMPGIWVLLSAIIGGGVAGPVGILLGVPIGTIFYILLRNAVRQKESLGDTEQV